MKLNFEIADIHNITEILKKEMFRLMESHYANMLWEDFISDLSEKQWVILLFNKEAILVGFSTQLIIIPGNQSKFINCVILFSGDTIIDHEYWGSVALPVAFLQLVNLIQVKHPGKKVYWMLISKGLRTYRFLSVFLMEYYPCYFEVTPVFISDLMKYMGKMKFGLNYNDEKGIIMSHNGSQYLKESFQPEVKKNNQVADFFYKKNPGFNKGDELLCMAEISDSNLHPFIKRVVKNYG